VAIPLALWSAHAVLSRALLLDGCGAFELLFYRSLGALLFGMALLGGNPFANLKGILSPPGLLCVANFICFNMALKYISGYLVMILETSCFVFSLLYSLARRRKANVCVPAIALYLLGLGLLYWKAGGHGNADLMKGLFWGILVSATFGLFNSTLGGDSGKTPKLYAIMAPCFVFSAPAAAWGFSLKLPSAFSALLAIAVLGVLFTGAAYYFWSKAAERFSGLRLSELFLLTLPGTFLIEWLFLGVKIEPLELSASAILILATALNIWRSSGRELSSAARS